MHASQRCSGAAMQCNANLIENLSDELCGWLDVLYHTHFSKFKCCMSRSMPTPEMLHEQPYSLDHIGRRLSVLQVENST